MTKLDKFNKRSFDVFLSIIGILVFSPIIIFFWLLIFISSGANGFFFQERVGMNGKIFRLVKLKTMKNVNGKNQHITIKSDIRITKLGSFLRKYKIDELPQIYNVLVGQMSIVGPRPDVKGYADGLKGENRLILSVRPGITGPASIKYKNEEEVLDKEANPQTYNDEVIWPDKVRINTNYVKNWSLIRDLYYIFATFKN